MTRLARLATLDARTLAPGAAGGSGGGAGGCEPGGPRLGVRSRPSENAAVRSEGERNAKGPRSKTHQLIQFVVPFIRESPKKGSFPTPGETVHPMFGFLSPGIPQKRVHSQQPERLCPTEHHFPSEPTNQHHSSGTYELTLVPPSNNHGSRSLKTAVLWRTAHAYLATDRVMLGGLVY